MKHLKEFHQFATKPLIIDWSVADKLIPNFTKFIVQDIQTAKTWNMMRTSGKYHADVEPVTKEDYNIMKEVFPKEKDFVTVTFRPVIITIYGNQYGCALMGFPHAGSLTSEFGERIPKRSGGFGAGINWDYLRDNGVTGHFCLHFRNSIKHTDKMPDKGAQQAINYIEKNFN